MSGALVCYTARDSASAPLSTRLGPPPLSLPLYSSCTPDDFPLWPGDARPSPVRAYITTCPLFTCASCTSVEHEAWLVPHSSLHCKCRPCSSCNILSDMHHAKRRCKGMHASLAGRTCTLIRALTAGLLRQILAQDPQHLQKTLLVEQSKLYRAAQGQVSHAALAQAH